MFSRLIILICSVCFVCFADNSALAQSNIQPQAAYSAVEEQFVAAHREYLKLLTGEGKDIQFRYLFEPDHDIEDANGANISLNEFLIDGEVPIVIDRDFFIRSAATFSSRFYDLHAVTLLGEPTNSEKLYKAQVGVGVGYFATDRLFLTALLTPGIFSTFNSDLDQEQVRIYGEAFIVYEAKPRLQLIAGTVANRNFEEVRVYPVIAARYQSPDGLWHFKITPPVAARLGYLIQPDLQIYTGFNLTGDRYRVRLENSGNEFDIQIQDKRLGFGVVKYLTPHWNISGELGVAITNKYSIKISRSETLPGSNTDSTVYAFLSLGYSL